MAVTRNRQQASRHAAPVKEVTREKLIDLLNEDLAREYQAVIAYVVYSAIAEDIRHILVQEQEHQIDLATALGKDVVEVSKPEELV